MSDYMHGLMGLFCSICMAPLDVLAKQYNVNFGGEGWKKTLEQYKGNCIRESIERTCGSMM